MTKAMTERPTLILLPGLLCDASVWAHQMAHLSDLASVVVAELRGFDSIDAMAESVLAQAPPRFALAGHSMGGRVALEVARRAPERVERLALLDTGIHPRRDGEETSRGALVALARTEGMAAMARRWLPPMVHPERGAEPALMEPLTAMVCATTPDVFAGQQKALLNRRDASVDLPAIACPTAVIVGRQDGWSPPAQHEEIANAIPGAVLTVIEDSGHMSTVERPEAVTAALRLWLGGDA